MFELDCSTGWCVLWWASMRKHENIYEHISPQKKREYKQTPEQNQKNHLVILCRSMSFPPSNLTGDVIQHHPYVLSLPKIKMCIPNQNLDRIQCNKNHQAVATLFSIRCRKWPILPTVRNCEPSNFTFECFLDPWHLEYHGCQVHLQKIMAGTKKYCRWLADDFSFPFGHHVQVSAVRFALCLCVCIYIYILFMNIDLTCSVCTLSWFEWSMLMLYPSLSWESFLVGIITFPVRPPTNTYLPSMDLGWNDSIDSASLDLHGMFSIITYSYCTVDGWNPIQPPGMYKLCK